MRDAYLIEDSITEEMRENLDTPYTEAKSENTIDRITSAANPRVTERIPAGAKFKAEFIVNQYDTGVSDDTKYLNELITSLKLLESDYLGGSGSRGYGKISLRNIKIEFRSKEYYEKGVEPKTLEFDDLKNIDPEKLSQLL